MPGYRLNHVVTAGVIIIIAVVIIVIIINSDFLYEGLWLLAAQVVSLTSRMIKRLNVVTPVWLRVTLGMLPDLLYYVVMEKAII